MSTTLAEIQPANSTDIATAIVSIWTMGERQAKLYTARSIVTEEIDCDELDAAIIAARRNEPSEPLDSVLDELGLNE